METNNQKQQQNNNSDSNKKESTCSGGNDDTPSTSSSKPKDILHDDLCSICFDDVSILDNKTFVQYECCGKVMHMDCNRQLANTKSLSFETRCSCPMCRAPNAAYGSKEHIERLQKWSRRNRSWAQFGLGCLHRDGEGVKKDPIRACELYKLAADQGYHHAQHNLAGMYAQGEGVIQSVSLAYKYYKLSADQGFAMAQFKVGLYYDTGVEQSEQSDTGAVKYYKLAADQGHCLAQNNLGNMYAQGQGVNQSDTLSLEFFKLAAKQDMLKHKLK